MPLAIWQPELKWESTLSRNVGLDVSLFNNRLQVSLDAYLNDTRDLLINVPIAANSGFSTQLQNVGSVRNRGLELQLSTTAISKNDFKWNINFNIATNRNEIIKLSNVSRPIFRQLRLGPGNEYLGKGRAAGRHHLGIMSQMACIPSNDFDYNPANSAYVLKKGVADNTALRRHSCPGNKEIKRPDRRWHCERRRPHDTGQRPTKIYRRA